MVNDAAKMYAPEESHPVEAKNCCPILSYILKQWLSMKLQKTFSWSPEEFGKATQDGLLVAGLLQNYGVIPSSKMDMLSLACNIVDFRNNYSYIKQWLKLVNIEMTREDIECLTEGKGSVALRLFYQIFLELEDKTKSLASQKKYHETLLLDKDSELKKQNSSGDILNDLQNMEQLQQLGGDVLLTAEYPMFAHLSKDTFNSCNVAYYTYEQLKLMEEKAMIEASKEKHVDKIRLDEYLFRIKKMRRYHKNLGHLNEKTEKSILDKMKFQCKQNDNEINAVKTLLSLSQYECHMATQLMQAKQEMLMLQQKRVREQEALDKQRELEFNLALDEMRAQMTEINDERLKYRMSFFTANAKSLHILHREIGEGTVLSLLDYTWKFLEFKGMTGEDEIPPNYLHEWKNILLTKQAITGEQIDCQSTEVIEEIYRPPEIQVDILDNLELNDYHYKSGLWELQRLQLNEEAIECEGSEARTERMMARMIYTFLAKKYPLSNKPVSMPQKKTAAIILEASELFRLSNFINLLSDKHIVIISLDHAINYCLTIFQKEAIDFGEFDAKQFEIAINNLNTDIENFMSLKSTLARSASTTSSHQELEVEKETQTPAVLPTSAKYSDVGQLGIIAVNMLLQGSQFPDCLLASIMAEYLRSQLSAEGWVLKDYPETYEQAIMLETLLAGHKLPELQELVGASPEPSEPGSSQDNMIENHLSWLYPEDNKPDHNLSTYFTAFLKLRKSTCIKKEDFIWKLTEENSNALERYYADEGINYSIYYEKFDDVTISCVLKYITGDIECILKNPSHSLENPFASCSPKLEKQASKTKILKGRFTVKDGFSSATSMGSKSDYTGYKDLEIGIGDQPFSSNMKRSNLITDSSNSVAKDRVLPVAEDLLVGLASMWENVERTYIEDLKQLFSLKRQMFSKIIPYFHYVRETLSKSMPMYSIKQDLVSSFQRKFNAITVQARKSSLVKAELYIKLQDLQRELTNISETEKAEAEEQRRLHIQGRWAVETLTTMSNIFVNLMQSELNRTQQTLKILYDYYIAMVNGTPAKELLKPFDLMKITPDSNIGFLDENITTVPDKKAEKSIKSSSKGKGSVKAETNEICLKTICSLLQEFLTQNRDMSNDQNPFVKYLTYSKKYAEKYITALSSFYTDIIEKEKNKTTKTKKKDIKRKSALQNNKTDLMSVSSENVFGIVLSDWEAMLGGELCRLRLRLHMLQARALVEVHLTKHYTFKAFTEAFKIIEEKYNRDINLIDFLKVFQLATEKEAKVLTPILFSTKNLAEDIDRIINGIMERDLSKSFEKFDLPISRLSALRDKLKLVAHKGSMPKEPFIIMLQDFFLLDPDDSKLEQQIEIWAMLDPKDFIIIINKIYGNSSYIDWRVFLIMCTGMCFPTQDEVMQLRRSFIELDEYKDETISRIYYLKIKFWFEDENSEGYKDFVQCSLMKDFFFELFEVSIDKMNYSAFLLALCRHEDQTAGFTMALSVAIGRPVCADRDSADAFLRLQHADKVLQDLAHKSALVFGDSLVESMVEHTINICSGVHIIELISPHDSAVCLETLDITPQQKEKPAGRPDSFLLEELDDNDLNKVPSKSKSYPTVDIPTNPLSNTTPTNSLDQPTDLVYCIDEETVRRVLLVSLPWHCREEFLPPYMQLLEGLNRVFADLKYTEETDKILICNLLEHEYIQQFLEDTQNFKIIHPCRLAVDMVTRRENDFDLNFL